MTSLAESRSRFAVRQQGVSDVSLRRTIRAPVRHGASGKARWSTNAERDRESLQRAAKDAQSALTVAANAASEAAARALMVAEVLDEALAILSSSSGGGGAPPRLESRGLIETLSPRQREVLVLIAEGRSNRSIAETLFVSPNTVKTHVASLLTKLHVDTRVQLAAIAARHGVR